MSAELSQTNKDEEVNLNQNLTNSDQILEAVPAEDLDVVTLNNENSISSENDDVTNVVTPKTGNSITDLSFVATASISSSNTSLHQIKFWDLYNSEYEVDLNTTVRKDHQGINRVSSSETRKRKKREV